MLNKKFSVFCGMFFVALTIIAVMVIGPTNVEGKNLWVQVAHDCANNLNTLDNDTILLDSTAIDQYGYQVLMQESPEAQAIENATASHPLGGNEKLVLKLEELAISAGSPNPSGGWVLDDQLHNFSQPLAPGTLPSTDYINKVDSIASGNFDNDVAEELVVVGSYITKWTNLDIRGDFQRVILYDDCAHNYSEIRRYNFVEPSDSSLNTYGGVVFFNHVVYHCVAAGDFDGDGIDEFAIVNSVRGDDMFYFQGAIDMKIHDPVDDTTWSWTKYGPIIHISKWTINLFDQPKLAVGNLDGDGLEELVLTTTGILSDRPEQYKGWVFEYSNGNYSDPEYYWTNDMEGHEGMYKNDMVLGDIDGDLREEIIYLMKMEDESWDSIWIKDDEIYLFQNVAQINITHQALHQLDNDGVLGAGDLDGDGFDEIVVYSLEAGDKFGVIFDDLIHDFQILKKWEPSDISSFVSKELTLGDIDADGMDEIILSTGDNQNTIYGEAGIQTAIFDDAKSNYSLIFYDAERKGFITTGDFDADGVQLKYTGEKWTTTAPPKPVIAIAAPPTYQGISQNYIATDTMFGSETSKGAQEENSIGVSEGAHWSKGAKAEFEAGFFKTEASFKFRKTVMNEFLRTKTKTETTTTALGYASGYSDDSVIYQITQFDNYKYEITSHPTNPDAIGQFLTFDIPQETSLWKTTIANYNAQYSAIAPRIGSETFVHTVGKPRTYPNISIIDSIAPCWRTRMQTVGQGVGFQTCSIEIEIVSTREMSLTSTTELSYEFEGSMGIGGKDPISGIGGGFYFTAGKGWTSAYIDVRKSAISVGKTCVYEGAVGDIEDEETWNQLKYSFALVVYNLARPEEGVRYQVINYIVDAKATPTPTPSAEPEPQPEPFPVVLVATASVIVALVGVCLLVYFKKRKH